MNFFTTQTKALVITGQLRLHENESPVDRINYHIDYFKPDYTYLFLWDYEYEQYGEIIKQIPNTEIITAKYEDYKIPDFEMQHMILQLRKYLMPSIIRREETLLYTDHVKSINVFMLHYYIMQKTFSQINLKHSTYIKTRYDNLYLENINNTQLNQIYDFLDDEIPTIATPFGGDAENIGLGDLVVFTNKKGAQIFQNIYDELTKECIKQLAPSFPEGALRYMFRNLNQATIYRLNFPSTTIKMKDNNFILHPSVPFNIIRDNTPIPIAKYPTNVPDKYKDLLFDLPLVKNAIM